MERTHDLFDLDIQEFEVTSNQPNYGTFLCTSRIACSTGDCPTFSGNTCHICET